MKNIIFIAITLMASYSLAVSGSTYRAECAAHIINARQAFVKPEEIRLCSNILSPSASLCVFKIARGREALLNATEISLCGLINSEPAYDCVAKAFNGRAAIAGAADILSCAQVFLN